MTQLAVPIYLTARELAARYQVSVSKAYLLAAERRVPTIHLGASVRFPLVELEKWERTQVVPARN